MSPDPRDFLPARPPFLPLPERVARERLNKYKEQPVKQAVLSAEEKLLSAIFGPKAMSVLMVKCNGCGRWLKDNEAIYLNYLAYHSMCAAKLYEEG